MDSRIAIQRDLGAFWYVEEEHVDHLGLSYRWAYTPAKSVDVTVKLATHAEHLLARLAKHEIKKNIQENVLSTEYITKAELADAIREKYREGDKDDILKIARWIRSRIQAGDFTEAQVRNVFGLTQAQWNAFKVRLQSYEEALAVIEGASGE